MDPKIILMILLLLWVIPWKGWALWLAARRKDKWWFIVLLIVNSLAILEIIYIFAIAKRSDKREKDTEFGEGNEEVDEENEEDIEDENDDDEILPTETEEEDTKND